MSQPFQKRREGAAFCPLALGFVLICLCLFHLCIVFGFHLAVISG